MKQIRDTVVYETARGIYYIVDGAKSPNGCAQTIRST